MAHTDMDKLIARLEQASEGSRMLDAEIADACIVERTSWPQLHYTTSLDAALSLLENGSEYSITTLYGIAHVEVGLNASDDFAWRNQQAGRADGNVILAFVTAALKAKARRPA